MIALLSRLPSRVRLVLTLLSAVTPFALVLSFANLWVYRPMQDDVQVLSDRIQERFEEVSALQLLLARSAMPPNDYLLHGRQDERIRFELMAGRIENTFKELRRGVEPDRPRELEQLDEMQGRWKAVREMGTALLEWPTATRLTDGAVAMEKFDREVDRLTEDAESLVAHVRADLEDARNKAIGRRHDLNRFVALSTAVAGILTILLVGYLARGLTAPRELQRPPARPTPQEPPAESLDDQVAAPADAVPAAVDAESDQEAGPAVDPVTRLWSRSSLRRQLAIETERAMVLETPSSIALIAIDRFEVLAEKHGEQATDWLVVALSERVRHVIRQTDFPARSGPGEFAVLMPATDVGRASEIAERIRQHVAERPIGLGSRTLAVTVSIGVAGDGASRGGHAGASTLLGRADQALRRAGRGAGNRVELSGWAA